MVGSDIGRLAAGLAEVLAAPLGGSVEVGQLQRLPGGASRLTWSFDAKPVGGGVPVPLVLQQQRPGGLETGAGMATEAAVLRAAARAGVPVAELVLAAGDPGIDVDAAGLGRSWLVMRRIEGETVPRRVFRDDALAEARGRMVADCGRALAAVHRIPVAEIPGLAGSDRLDQQRELLDQFDEAHPALELGLRWLAANRPPPGERRMVHGDFRTGNLLIGLDGLRAVLDWELVHLGDPLEDLGWFCVRAWRFGSPLPAGGFGTREELISAYEAAGGQPVDPDALHWWEVLGTLSWGVICMVQAATHRAGIVRSVELATIGRRVCETEHDLLELLP